ncbi:MAG: hypothetical protein PHE68_03330 [Candidatus Peribacteraceae bacterium]|nr:hypothetical protein [Candidatus Peribacteraceae bacterium]
MRPDIAQNRPKRIETDQTHSDNDASNIAFAFHAYLEEQEECRAICACHSQTAAIHDRGKELQIYRLFNCDEITARHIRVTAEALPSWEYSIYWQKDGVSHRLWKKMQNEVRQRMIKHDKIHEIITCGVEWEGRPVLIHAYKFEPDPVMKVELILAPYVSPVEELSLHIIASLLRCHTHLVPEYIAEALPPYKRHETRFLTVSDYLSKTMPRSLYAAQCLQGVSCHTSNGVGSRDTPREHHPASHSINGSTQATKNIGQSTNMVYL